MGENARLKNLLKKIKINESTISMLLGALVVLVVGSLIINYFRNVSNPLEEKGETPASVEEISGEPKDLPTIHIVQNGDTLWKIAEKYWGSGYNWVDIVSENQLNHPNLLVIGTELKITKTEVIRPPLASKESAALPSITGDSYTIVKGDNLWKIAVRAYGDGYQWVKLARENKLSNPNLIHPGNVLKISR